MSRAADILAHIAALPFAPLDRALPPGPVLVIAPHQDDESLGCGGLIARAGDEGRTVHVAFLTDGTGSHPNSRAYPAPRLRALREAEALEACAALGVPEARVRFLGVRDTQAPHEGPDFDRAADAVADLARACGAATILVTWQHDPHGDHGSASKLARVAAARVGARLLSYPVWGWTLQDESWLPDTLPAGFRLDITAQVDRKQRAIAAHRSQTTALIDDDPDGFRLDAAMLAHFARPFEVFLDD